jgi:phosphonate transport system substrate-binding protein
MKNTLYPILLALIGLSFIPSCSGHLRTSVISPAKTELIKETQAPTSEPSPTPAPFGDAMNPIVLGAVFENPESQLAAATLFVQSLADQTGLVFRVVPYTDVNPLINDLGNGKVAITWLQPITTLYANEMDYAEPVFLFKNFGVYGYGSQIIAKNNPELNIFFDPVKETSNSDAANAIRQFSGTRPCFIDDRSAAGYLVPLGLINQAGIQIEEPAFLRSYASVIRALYAGEICAFGATYAISGDPRTGQNLEEDLPDVLKQVIVIWRTNALIPTLNLSISSRLDHALQEKITAAILAFSSQTDSMQTISTMTNYEIEAIKTASIEDYAALREIATASGVNLATLLGK